MEFYTISHMYIATPKSQLGLIQKKDNVYTCMLTLTGDYLLCGRQVGSDVGAVYLRHICWGLSMFVSDARITHAVLDQ